MGLKWCNRLRRQPQSGAWSLIGEETFSRRAALFGGKLVKEGLAEGFTAKKESVLSSFKVGGVVEPVKTT